MKLNVEQRKIIELEPSGHSLIKGVAGSGKTTVAIRRIAFLQNHYAHEDDDKILLVTFNKTLLKYIDYQYKELRDEEESLQSLFGSNSEVVIQNIDKLMFSFFMRYQTRNKVKYNISKPFEERQAIQKAVHAVKERFPDIKVLSPKNSSFLLEEIAWIKASNIPDQETYQNIDRIGRGSGGQGNPQKLLKNSDTRAVIYELMEVYDKFLLDQGKIDFKTMNQLALLEVAEVTSRKYTHIIIDESQDLSKVQLEFLKHIYLDKSYSSIMFVADNTQSIYPQSWLGKGRPYTTIGYDMVGKSRTLSKNYRTTTEISKAAYGLIEQDEQIRGNVDFVKPSLIDRHGHAPIYRYFVNTQQQLDFLIEEITSLHNDYSYRDICLVAREKRIIESTATSLEGAGIPCELLNTNEPKFAADTVKLITMHSIKGLEFKVIFLINLDEGVIPNNAQGMDDEETLTEERKLMYVGMTRANELLYMSSVNRPSCFIREIDNSYVRMTRDSSLRPFLPIPIQDYRLTGQIVDLNAKEEVVRQWLLREIVHTFGYPLELITLEYPVQQFSKRGYVDIAITIEMNGKRIPYIFAEVKAFASGISTGLEQLKTYMAADTNVRYGIVTDGAAVKIIDRNGELVSDVPPCQPQFKPNTKRSRTYMDLRHQRSYQYAQDLEDETNVEIIDATTNLVLDVDVDKSIPVIGDVAAGIPTTAIEHFEESILLSDEWIIQSNSTFALKVKGDSMIGAGIDIGDLVIVHKQEAVTNGDIVIALIGQEATMKKYMLMGDSVLLISENPNYEPIQMNPSDVVINGKVIGVLKG
ncbi:transcriptional repressor LexA [Radiobacillus sp. PE A8.2]|uniref:transcriptional repressor LexA n=1 Tax=Radiobacillus sp. PE A8.2 TaxID=3380349 RepID=UPI00389094C6